MPDVRRASLASMQSLALLLAVLLLGGCRADTDGPAYNPASPSPVPSPALTFDSGVTHVPLNLTRPNPSAPRYSEPLRVGGDVSAPLELRRVLPEFPDRCAGFQFEGVFIVEAIISRSGHVSGVRTLRPAVTVPPCPEAEAAVRKALAQWLFKPAMYRGQPVPVYLTVPVPLQQR